MVHCRTVVKGRSVVEGCLAFESAGVAEECWRLWHAGKLARCARCWTRVDGSWEQASAALHQMTVGAVCHRQPRVVQSCQQPHLPRPRLLSAWQYPTEGVEAALAREQRQALSLAHLNTPE